MNEKTKLPEYGKNSLRPNPHAAKEWDGSLIEGPLAFAMDTIMVGDFGGDDADARRTNGLPSTEPEKPGKRRGRK